MRIQNTEVFFVVIAANKQDYRGPGQDRSFHQLVADGILDQLRIVLHFILCGVLARKVLMVFTLSNNSAAISEAVFPAPIMRIT